MKVKGQVNVVELKFQFPINFAIVVHVSRKDRMMMVFFVTVLLLPLLGVRGVELRNDIDRVIADLNVTIATSQVSR